MRVVTCCSLLRACCCARSDSLVFCLCLRYACSLLRTVILLCSRCSCVCSTTTKRLDRVDKSPRCELIVQ